MSDDHGHSHHDHDHDHDHGQQDHGHKPAAPAAPELAVVEDAGSRALAEALKSSFRIVQLGMAILIGVFLFSGFFKIGPQERAVILRFGAPVGGEEKALLGPGLHWSFPYPIDEVVRIPYSEIQQVKSTVGWYFTTPEKEALGTEDMVGPTQGLNPAVDGYVVMGDGDIIHARATLSYRIEYPIRYKFDFANASNTVQNALDSALIYAAARFKVDDALTTEQARFQEAVRARVAELLQKQNVGIAIQQCQVQTKPPRQLKQPFDAVLTAVSIRDKVLNDAASEQNKITNRAAADATGIINAARAESDTLVKSVQADAKYFTDLLPHYRANPQLTVNILLSEKVGQVLTNAQEKWYLPERTDGKPWEIRLQLNREPLAPKQPATPVQ
jgi:membrane protease subunit HflK